MKKYGVIYKITNKINNKCYIGQTTCTISKRWNEHCCSNKKTVISLAIKKYGKDNFIIEELGWASDQKSIDDLETNLIKSHNTLSPNGYNIKLGGNGKGKLPPYKVPHYPKNRKSAGPRSAETYAKIAAKNLGKKRTEATKLKQSLVKVGKSPIHLQVSIIALNIKTKEELSFKSIQDAANKLDCLRTSISNILAKKSYSIRSGWTFKYAGGSIVS